MSVDVTVSAMRPSIRNLALILLLASAIGLEVWQAYDTAIIPMDEPLWFARSHWTPADFKDADGFFYAIDIPGLNRWAYWAVLKLTGLDRVRRHERECWSLDSDGNLLFKRFKPGGHWVVRLKPDELAAFSHQQGKYAPRRSIMAMRLVNIAAFSLTLVSLWWVANLVLKNAWFAVLAVLPVFLAPAISMDVAFVSWSGDSFLLPMFAVTLAVWMWFHTRNRGASWTSALALGCLCGVATSAKLTGVLLLAACALYLVIVSGGVFRLVKPVVSCCVALLVFCIINPVMFGANGLSPLQVVAAILARRSEVAFLWTAHYGPLGWNGFFGRAFFWWPLVPIAILTFWKRRERPWFLPLVLWSGVITAGVLLGVRALNRADETLYASPFFLSVFFPVALVLLSFVKGDVTERKP